MAGERIVFTEESDPNQYLKLVARGELDEYLLEALEITSIASFAGCEGNVASCLPLLSRLAR